MEMKFRFVPFSEIMAHPRKSLSPKEYLDKCKVKCPGCGVSVPDVPENASYEEMLCNGCYEEWNE